MRGEEVAVELEGLGVAGAAIEEERDVDVAALDAFFEQAAEGDFEGVAVVGEAEVEVEKAVVDALEGESEGGAVFGGGLRGGEAGHGIDRLCGMHGLRAHASGARMGHQILGCVGHCIPSSISASAASVAGRRLEAVGIELQVVEPAVGAGAGHEFLVGADLGDAAALEDDDAVGAAHGGHAVGDDEDGAALHEVGERCLHEGFALGVERGGGFVEDQDGRVLQDGARDGEALAFAAGEARTFLADDGVVALGHAEDEVVRERHARGVLHAGERDVGLAVGDVVAHGVVEQDGLLRDFADLLAQRGDGDVAEIVAVDEDAAGGDDRRSAG